MNINEFINNHDNINIDWSHLFLNNIARDNYKKNLLLLNKENKEDITTFLIIIYEQQELIKLCYFLYDEDYNVYNEKIQELFKEENIFYCDLYKIILSRANKDNWDPETIKLIYYIIQLNLDNEKVVNYTNFLKESSMFNNNLFRQEDVDKKADELNKRIYDGIN